MSRVQGSLIGKAFATPFGRNFLRQQYVVFQQNLPFLTRV